MKWKAFIIIFEGGLGQKFTHTREWTFNFVLLKQEEFTWQEIWRTWNLRFLERLFSELFSANVSLWNQYKHIVFNIFSCRTLIISYRMLIITGKSNELTRYRKLCRNVTIFYRQELASLFQLQEKLKACRSSKLNFSRSSFIADGSHVKTVWIHAVVFSEHNIFHFWDNDHLFKYYPVKVPQNCFNSNQTWFKIFVNCLNETVM